METVLPMQRNEYIPGYGHNLGKGAFFNSEFPIIKDSFDVIRDSF